MSSSAKNDNTNKESDLDEHGSSAPKQYYEENYDEAWDEWYDESVFQNKKSKLKRSKKRLYKNRDEW